MDSTASRSRGRLAAFLSCALLATPAFAILPWGQPNPADPYNYASYLFINDGDCSTGTAAAHSELRDINFDCGAGNWKASDVRDASHPETASNPQELYGVVGPGLNRAWEVSTGRPDVTIAVLDSGILWQHPHPELVNKVRINRRELPKPICASGQTGNAADRQFGGYDCDGNGVFNVADYSKDSRVHDVNGNGLLDPEDLILTFSDSTDADGNGYVDDIAGWDFYENDNDPQDDVEYGHGTGEAQSSASEAGMSDAYCPNCMFIPLRVGSSFVADIDHYAQAVVYATDNGVSVIQEALGTINHTSFAQAANDYAYQHGVIIHASEADEAAGHHNWPAALDHRMVINSIRNSSFDPAVEPHSYLFFNGCTNFGGYTYVSIPSTRCSSEATGKSAGVSGDLVSAARNAVDRGNMTNYLRDGDGAPADFPLSAEEMMQMWRIAADDIDFSSPCPLHGGCDDPPAGVTPAAPPNNYAVVFPDPSVRYQSVRGWDFFFGYGRANYNKLLHQVGRESADRCAVTGELCAQDRIPPEADITSPLWWAQYPYKSDMTLLAPRDGASDAIVIQGRVAANRVTAAGGSFDWFLEWAPGAQGQSFPLGAGPVAGSEETSDGPWTTIASGSSQHAAMNGELGRLAIADVVKKQSGYAYPFLVDPTSPFQPEQYAIRLRVRVIAHPLKFVDTVNNEAVFQKQIDVYPAMETVMRDDLGRGGARGGGSPSPSFHDLDGDGRDELIVASDDGIVHAYTNVITGEELPGWPVHTAPIASIPSGGSNNAYARNAIGRDYFTSILGGSMAVADLGDDGVAYVIAGDIDGRLYAWSPRGQLKPGFPVTVDYAISREAPCGASTIPHCDDYLTSGKKRDVNNRRNPSISFAPAVGDLDRGYPGREIVASVGDGHVYAWHADGSMVPGWPVVLRDPQAVTAMNPATQFYQLDPASNPKQQGMIIVTPSLGDLDGDGNLEIVVGANEEYVETPNANLPLSLITQALAPLDLIAPGNTRLYVLHHDGFAHPADANDTNASVAGSPHTEDQAYLRGWPVKMALITTELLPDVGEGTNSPAALADIDGDGHPEIIAASAAGPGYIFKRDGTSFLGYTNGNPNTLSINPVTTDTPAFVAVGALSVGSLDGSHLTIAGPGAGLHRMLDLALEEQQPTAADHVSLWNASSGEYEPLAPVIVNDLQFFTQPVIADVTGDGLAEVIQGTAVNDTVVAGIASNAQATRYHSGGWTVSAAAVGAAPIGEDEISALSIATTTREGTLRLYRTTADPAACDALTQWPEYGHDAFHSGNYGTDAERPYPLRDLHLTPAGSGYSLGFLATGDDRDCGQAASYRVRLANPAVPDDWNAALPIATAPVSGAPGTPLSVSLPALPSGSTVLVRAFDDADNGSAVAKVTLPAGPEPTTAALAVVAGTPVTLTKGSSTPAVSVVRVANVGGQDARVDSLTLELSDPSSFARIVISSPDGQHATLTDPSTHPVFAFSPAINVAAHGATDFTVEYDMKPVTANAGGWSVVHTANASDGATVMQASWLALALLLIAIASLPRRAALAAVFAIALFAGCGGGSHPDGTICTTPTCTDDDNGYGEPGGGSGGGGGNGGGGGGGGGGGQAGTVKLIAVAAHDLSGVPVTPAGLPVLLANVSP